MDIELYKKLLKEKGMTYEDLANKTGFSLGCIKRIMAEIAKYPRADTIQAIERALGLDGNANNQSNGAELEEDEKELLALYRSLMPDYKALALTNLRTWAGVKPSENDLKKKA